MLGYFEGESTLKRLDETFTYLASAVAPVDSRASTDRVPCKTLFRQFLAPTRAFVYSVARSKGFSEVRQQLCAADSSCE